MPFVARVKEHRSQGSAAFYQLLENVLDGDANFTDEISDPPKKGTPWTTIRFCYPCKRNRMTARKVTPMGMTTSAARNVLSMIVNNKCSSTRDDLCT